MSRSHSRIASLTLALFVSATVLSACGGSDSNAGRTRNAAMSSQSPLPYSCAQLEPGAVNDTTAYVYFSICDEAERYSIVTPDGLEGSIPESDVEGREVIEVPVSSTIDGEPTLLIIETEGATRSDSFHPGVHFYKVVLSRADTNLVSSDDPFNGALYPKVTYTMPASQAESVYQTGSQLVGADQYVAYLEEYVHKWAMIRATTCYSSLGLSVMSQISPKAVLTHALIDAKIRRNRNLYMVVNSLRNYLINYETLPARCAVGTNSYNIFTNGVNEGFVPIAADKISTTDNIEELLKTSAITWFQAQVVNGQCTADVEVSDSISSADLQQWGDDAHQRLEELAANSPIALAAENQLTILNLLAAVRSAYQIHGLATTCSQLPAGYSVAVAQPFEVLLESTSETLPKVELPEIAVIGDVVQSAEPTLAEAAAAVIEENSQTQTQSKSQPEISYTAPLPKPTLKVGSTMSKASVVAASDLAISKKSKVAITRLSASKKFCSLSKTRVRAVRAGVCKLRVSVSSKGAKTLSKTVSITVTK